MKTLIKLLLVCLITLFSFSCNTYYIAASTQPTGIYSEDDGSAVAYEIPVGTVLLLKGKPKNGLSRVRYHADNNWYWIDVNYVSLIPNENPKYYKSSYPSLETHIAKGGSNLRSTGLSTSSGYDATIQTGSRGGKYYINKNGNKTYVKRSSTSGSTKHVGGKGSRGGKH